MARRVALRRRSRAISVFNFRMSNPAESALIAAPLREASAAQKVRAALQRYGRVHISGVLDETTATRLYDAMKIADWRLALNGDKDAYDFSATDVSAMNPAQQEQVLQVVHAKAGGGFQYLFDTHRISDEYDAGRITTGALAEFYVALNKQSMLAFMRDITGEARIAYLDAQATRYRAGHFLTQHDDDIEGKDRLFGFVFNLTPAWRADWGGLLMFIDDQGHISEAFTPAWNALNILKVPQAHAVTMVAPIACGFRYSITGWMRSRRPP